MSKMPFATGPDPLPTMDLCRSGAYPAGPDRRHFSRPASRYGFVAGLLATLALLIASAAPALAAKPQPQATSPGKARATALASQRKTGKPATGRAARELAATRNGRPTAGRKATKDAAAQKRIRRPNPASRPSQAVQPPRGNVVLAAAATAAAALAPDAGLPVSNAGQKLTVATVERQPFTAFAEDGKVTGFSADLWREIARRNNWTFDWKREETFPGMINAVRDRSAEVAIANISITAEREEFLDFSQPIYDSGLQIVVPARERGIGFFQLILRSGALQLVGLALLMLLAIAHILWFFERGISDRRHDYFRDDYRGGVWDAFWWAFVIMTMGGFENEVPHSRLSRVLAMVWIVTSLFLVSTLTAKITTSLTVDQLISDISSYRDLMGKRVGVGENSAMARFLDQQNIPYRKYKDFKAALAAVEAGELDATIGDAPVAQYYVANKGAGKVLLAGSVFNPDKFCIALPQGSTLREPINRSLLAIREDGSYEMLRRRWFGTNE